MNYRMVGFVLGRIFLIEAVLMLFPMGCAAIYGEWSTISAFLWPALILLALGLAVTAYARGGLILGHVFGWGNNMEITTGIDENSESYNEVRLHTENLTPPVVQRGGRMIFIVNNESIDITGELSPTKAFRYDYTDTDGNTHVWLVGLVSDDTANYGYAEYIKRSDGTWLGGCSVGVSLDADGRSSALWLESAKQELNIHW